LNNNGSFSYTPDTNYYGIDSFTYIANDSLSDSNIATVTITINPINDPPIAYDDSYSVDEGGLLNVIESGVLINDIDNENEPLNAILDIGPNYASSFSFNLNGSFNYVHDSSETFSDNFTYYANDGTSNSNVATVTITINPINDAPVILDIPDQTIDEGNSFISINLDYYVNDVDNFDNEMNWSYSGNVELTVSINASRNATINIPNSDWFGSENITFRATDPGDLWAEDNVTFTVIGINDPPVANNDSYNTNEDVLLNIPAPGILNNDTDIEGDTLAAVQISGPTNGSLILNSNGSFIYTPNPNYYGIDSFTYFANDSLSDSNIATVTISVFGVNDYPVANDDNATVIENTSNNQINVLLNDYDVDEDPLTIISISTPENGTAATDGDYVYYTASYGYENDTFTYTIEDTNGSSDIATINITIIMGNFPPIANNDDATTTTQTETT